MTTRTNRRAREDRVAREREGVRRLVGVLEVVVLEREVRHGELVAHAERLGELARDVAIARPAHAVVDLREQQHVRARELGIALQRRDQAREVRAALDVPRDRAKRARQRLHAGRVAMIVAVEHDLDVAPDLRPQRAREQLLARADRAQLGVVRRELVVQHAGYQLASDSSTTSESLASTSLRASASPGITCFA